jgi:hypothetical protein
LFLGGEVDVILISESWLKPNIPDQVIFLPGYKIIRNDRLGKVGGGVAMYIKSNLKFKILSYSSPHYCSRPEFLFIEIVINNIKFLLGVCYKPPKIGFLSDFENNLLGLLPSYNHTIIMGDFNSDLLKPGTFNYNQLTSMFFSCNLSILPLNATHHTNHSNTLLDIMVVSDPALIIHHGQIPVPGISSHDLIFCVLSTPNSRPDPTFITYRDINKIDLMSFISDAYSLPWNCIYNLDNVDDMIDNFNYLILSLYDKHAPPTTRRVRKRPSPWITPEIKVIMAQRDAAGRRARRTGDPSDLSHYRRLRNKVKQEIRNAKIRFTYRSLSQQTSSFQKWQTVKRLGIGKRPNREPLSVDIDELNDFFVSPPGNITAAETFSEMLSTTPQSPADQFVFSPVDSFEVLRVIGSISSNATGADSIPIRFIKDTLFVTLGVLTFIFNKSLSSFTFPSSWKSSIIIPLKKKSNPSVVSDYRPISILPAISKCLERIVLKQVNAFLERNNILNNFQSGFRANHSTTTALINVTDSIRLAMDKRMVTILTLFDLSKAFDCVHHPLLLIKMKRMGFSENSLSWFRSYLSFRRQSIKSDNRFSDWKPVTRGVPQGSILGPLLFSLYINDIYETFSYCDYHLFADDLQVFLHFSPSTLNEAIIKINSDINSINDWIFKHGLCLNVSKTKTILICNSRLMRHFNSINIPALSIGGHQLQYISEVKNLGLTLNTNLSWNNQVNVICNRIFSGIHTLKRVRDCLPLNMKLMLVKTLIFPHFSYCDIVYNDLTVELSLKLQRAQNYCLRFIFNLRRDEHISAYYNSTGILKLEELRKLHILRLVYKVLNKKSPKYIYDKFVFSSQISQRSTRSSSSLLIIPQHRTVIFNKSFTVTAARLWNQLPDDLKMLRGSAQFTKKVSLWLVAER